MTLRDLLEYCKENNVPDYAIVCFENLDWGGTADADKVEYDKDATELKFYA